MQAYTCIYMHTYTCTYICTFASLYTYMYMHTNTYTCTYNYKKVINQVIMAGSPITINNLPQKSNFNCTQSQSRIAACQKKEEKFGMLLF